MYFGAALFIIMIGIYGVATSKNLIKAFVSLNIMETGVNILLIMTGFVKGGAIPIFSSPDRLIKAVDPLPQALVLTSIVIGFATTALGLVIVRLFFIKNGKYELDDSIYHKMIKGSLK